MNLKNFLFFALIVFIGFKSASSKKIISPSKNPYLLQWAYFEPYIKEFNQNDDESIVQYIPNSQAEEFLKNNIPYFQCPDKELEKTYYFRWWTFRKHINNTPDGFVITEFLRNISYAGKYNTISCPAGHHFYEGRWLHNQRFLEDYANFWFKKGGSPRQYSFWAANSILAFSQVHQNKELLTGLLPYFKENYSEWERTNLCEDGLFWQVDGRDGMEESVGGSGKRATINSYMIGEAQAIAEIAEMAGNKPLTEAFSQKAVELKDLLLSVLWDEDAAFFKTLPLNEKELSKLEGSYHLGTFRQYSNEKPELVDVRELHGYTPWYFNIPEEKHSKAWKFLLLKDGFDAPYGPTTAEQIHPNFRVAYYGHHYKGGTCHWDGPSWPFSTSITLKAMANLLRNYNQSVISKEDFVWLLNIYSKSHRRINKNGEKICWIDENINPFTGDWISRTMRMRKSLDAKAENYDEESQHYERGKDYNHSAFCDFIISDLVGIQTSMDQDLTIDPLVPENYWDWFCLDNVKVHNNIITVIWDKKGKKYEKGEGFMIYVNGELIHHSKTIKKITIRI